MRVGSGVTNGISVGDRVAVGPQSDACLCRRGVCQECASGRENYCHVHLTGTYNGRYLSGDKSFGGFGRYHRAPSHFVFRVPDGLPSAYAAPMMCAGLTTYSALTRNGCGPGKNVGIIGIGGLGHFGILWAKALGAEKVVSISRRSNKREDAVRLGADEYVATEEDVDWAAAHTMTLDLLICTVSSSQVWYTQSHPNIMQPVPLLVKAC